MLKIDLGYWQLSCARDVMNKAWKIVRKSKCSISIALRNSWKIFKKYFKNVSTSYKEYKYKLVINKQQFTLSSKDNDLDNIVEESLEKIAEVKGKSFIYKIGDSFYEKYDQLLSKFKKKGSLTFYQDIFLIKMRDSN
ncbi:hypothetical protein NPD5_3831 [Clostridium sporogenes]|uniref:Uncharacterized protein n=1 Tax=Clostridium sporogenes TaxID=1509 RepID=A0A1L3NCT7_CLOSG|nr:hypothetical protein [Clostridium sporogenes]APH13938.1 hypothetical protein NPD5_3831 [Clostridium sporogenes]